MRNAALNAFAVIFSILLAGCGDETRSIQAGATKALPFSIEEVSLSDMFKDDLKFARVNVGVTGGATSEWAATAIAIAEKTASFGADSIEVSVRRNEITKPSGIRFREVAHAYFSPNPRHTVWSNEKQWQIFVANPINLATQQDAEIDREFSELNEKLVARGMGIDAADKKAGIVIEKKYNLAKDWRLPLGNISFNSNELDRGSISVDESNASSSLQSLKKCMDGKILRVLKPCGQ